ncbi:MAG: peroxiredoxin-like family protein [Candidatus Korobacteraceae bacterium]
MKWRGLEDSQQQSEIGVPLSTRLKERRELIERYVPAETQAIIRQTVADLHASGIAQRVPGAGARISAFELPDHDGAPVSSQAFLTGGRMVLLFIRGRWCPFCVAQLEAMNEAAAAIRQAGAEIVAISPQKVHQSSLMRDQHRLGFSLLSDAGNHVARQFGLVYRIPEVQQKIYSRTFVNLPFLNGDSTWELPIPAAFVVDRDGSVLWSSASADYTERPEPAEILQALSR